MKKLTIILILSICSIVGFGQDTTLVDRLISDSIYLTDTENIDLDIDSIPKWHYNNWVDSVSENNVLFYRKQKRISIDGIEAERVLLYLIGVDTVIMQDYESVKKIKKEKKAKDK